jgi:transcription-repair coupling factor (superfamily II helicase)
VEEDVFIPQDYVTSAVERLNLYRRLAELEAPEEITAFRAELGDRFGPVPPAVDTLLLMAQMKPLAQALRLPRVTFKNERLFLTAPDQSEDPYFYAHVFNPLLEKLDGLGRRYVLKDSKAGKLRAIVQDVRSLKDAEAVLERLRILEPEPAAA